MTQDSRDALPAGARVGAFEIVRCLGRPDPFSMLYQVAAGDGATLELREYFPVELLQRDGERLVPVRSDAQAAPSWGILEFINEAQVLARISHPAFLRVHAAFEANGSAYFAREPFHGQTLGQRLANWASPGDHATLLELMRVLCDALALAHHEGFLHRGIGPDGIGFRADQSPVFLDCAGGANAIRFKSRYAAQIVRPGYSALEDYSPTGRQGPWTDVHALAVLAYRWLSGRLPPPAPARARGQLAEPLAKLAPHVPPGVAAAVEWGMALHPTARPASVADWLERLENGLSLTNSGSWVIPAALPATLAADVEPAPADAELESLAVEADVLAAEVDGSRKRGLFAGIGAGVALLAVALSIVLAKPESAAPSRDDPPAPVTGGAGEAVAEAANETPAGDPTPDVAAAAVVSQVPVASQAPVASAVDVDGEPSTEEPPEPASWSSFELLARDLLLQQQREQERLAAAESEAARLAALAQAEAEARLAAEAAAEEARVAQWAARQTDGVPIAVAAEADAPDSSVEPAEQGQAGEAPSEVTAQAVPAQTPTVETDDAQRQAARSTGSAAAGAAPSASSAASSAPVATVAALTPPARRRPQAGAEALPREASDRESEVQRAAAQAAQTDREVQRVAALIADARERCRIAAPDLSVDGRLLYENALNVDGAQQAGNAIRLPPVQLADGRPVRFEVLPDNCARLVR